MGDDKGKMNQDDISFLRTEDMICLSCTAASLRENSTNGERVSLAAEGFGNRMCFLQSMAQKELPVDISVCTFVLEQALSVRALQEMVSAKSSETAGPSAGHRTLLYGHAVLLRHSHSNMYLSCLPTQSSSSDKLAFDVGLQETPEGESCWWTIHPASKQRSEGEKVRVGDDLILVSVASERYLHIGAGAMVIASFQQTLWTVQPISSGSIRQKSLGFVFGGDVLRLFHGDECLTIPPRDADNSHSDEFQESAVMYETGAVQSHARSLWKLEHVRTKWAEGFMGWGQPCRLRHVTSGRYLAATEDNQVVTFHRSSATEDLSAFLLRQSKDDRKFLDSREDEGMGTADVKYGDSLVYVQHMKTGLWLSYQTFETKKRGVGRVEEKKAVLMVEGHMDDGVNMSRAQEEEDKSARVIRKCTSLISQFVKALESLKSEGRNSPLWETISLAEVIKTLEDLIEYFAPPSDELEFEERQIRFKALRNRQDLFQEEGMIALILETIDKCSQWKSMRHLSHVIGEDCAGKWNDMINYLYLLLAALIQGNHSNCTQFASPQRIDWLVRRLIESQTSSQGVLDVLHCVLIDSPEALNVIKEQHIRTIISLIDKHGRDPKVLNVLCSLCVGNGVAVRSNQNLICENLLPGRDLLLQTKVMDYVYCMQPNIFVGRCEGSAMYQMWYYEAIIDHMETVSHGAPHIRIGWANTEGFVPFPGGGSQWGCNGVGDDLFSYGFDGVNLWTAGKPKRVRTTQQMLQKGDIIGVCLDLSVPQISFSVNGNRVKGFFRDFNVDGMFHPCISISAKVSVRFMIGGDHGKLKYGPPQEHSPVYESLYPKEKLKIEPCFYFGDVPRGLLLGPAEVRDYSAFVPKPVETSQVQLPNYIENVRDKLAENIHESWAMAKIEGGWTYGDRRDDARRVHPCLTTFERLPPSERAYNLSLAQETLKTLVALNYHVTYDPNFTSNTRLKTLKLPQNFLQPNGYKPTPMDLSHIQVSERKKELVDLLAENTHNVWARERIKTGWTYGLTEDSYNKRSPHLVPYEKVDESIKKANRHTSSEAVKTLLAYGYGMDPPSNEGIDNVMNRHVSETNVSDRLIRAEKTYAVESGKWYYELEVITPGRMRVGWAHCSLHPYRELGSESEAYVFDGMHGCKWHQGAEPYGKIWQRGDVIGCMLDITDKTISFSLNGELMMDRLGQEIAFKGIETSQPLVPAFSLGRGQQAKVNFGQDVHSLKFFTCCGLQEGYEPFCVNMTRQMSFWYGKKQALFEPLEKGHPRVEVAKVSGGSSSPPCLKVNSKTYGTLETSCLEFLRLSLPVKFQDQFVPAREKQLTLEKRLNVENKKKSKAMDEDPRDYQDFMTPFERKPHDKRGVFKKKHHKLTHSMDDSSVETLDRPDTGHLRRHESETDLAKANHHHKNKAASKQSIIEKFADVSKIISDKQQGKRSKSPFALFKKPKSRDPSPQTPLVINPTPASIPAKVQVSASEYSEDEESEDLALGPTINISHMPKGSGHHAHHPVGMKKSSSMVSYGSELDSEPEAQDLQANIDIIDEYYYGVRIFPGQDPAQIYVGWVTPLFHVHSNEFDMKKVRNVVVCSLDVDYRIKSSVSRKNCYIVSAGDLQNRYSQREDSGKRMQPGLLIGCHCDTSTGILSFTVNGQEVANKFQVEPSAKLFPAVFFEPTNKEVLQFELGRTKTALPLSSALFRGGKHVTPQCPPRLDVQVLRSHSWARVPMMSLKVHTLKLSEIRGWSMLCEDPVQMMALHIPEEDRCLDIMELTEYQALREFHAHTLTLYRAVCSHGNHRAAHELTKHVDEDQLKFCIKSKYMPGSLRLGFHNLLISLHLEAHANSRLMTQREFIVPLASTIKSQVLYRDDQICKIKETIPSLEKSASIRPDLILEEKGRMTGSTTNLTSPYFPLDFLKSVMMDLLAEAVDKGAAYIRDPIGGSNANLFTPLVRVVDHLLVMGLLDDHDLDRLLCLIDPTSFDPTYRPNEPEAESNGGPGMTLVRSDSTVQDVNKTYGLLQIKLDEAVQLQLCHLLHHLCDTQLRHRVESTVAFSDGFVVDAQEEQLQRYNLIKQTDLPMAIAAKKTREFRCPPQEQMRALLAFHKEDLEGAEAALGIQCPCGDDLRGVLLQFHQDLLRHMNHPEPPPEVDPEELALEQARQMSWSERLLALVASKEEKVNSGDGDGKPDCMQKLIINTVITWAKEKLITNQDLVREMFSLIHRQFDGIGEFIQALEKSYVISLCNQEDIYKLQRSLGIVRALLPVQVGPDEEDILKSSIWDLADNRVFFQHPDLMRSLGIHETVMTLMVNTLNKAQQQSVAVTEGSIAQRRASLASDAIEIVADSTKDTTADMVVACCRFLCYFCRTGRVNQRAMFEHLSYLLDNSCMLLARPSLRGACPLDVAYSSLMDNNELSLALRESDLDKVAVYLSRCGQQSNQELLAKGYPDIGWDPVEGERFLDFLRFCVWVNGESVEENANLVVRLLIRRPECLGPALRGEGGGLHKAMEDGILMSLQIAAARDPETMRFLQAVCEQEDDDRVNFLQQSTYDFSMLPPEDDEDYIDMGGARLQFYSSLVDLLGHCAPDAQTIKAGRSDSIRARAILRSLVSMEDLEGVLCLRFILPIGKPEEVTRPKTSDTDKDSKVMRDDGEMETVVNANIPPGLLPTHKAAIVQFLERVYGVPDQATFFRLLEDCFLPDLRAATTLNQHSASESDMALALNRYVCASVLPLLTANADFFDNADHAGHLLDQTLHTVYHMSKCRSLTKNQRDTVSDFLVALANQLRPPMMTSLLKKLVVDVPALNENTIVPLRVLTNHYERCGRYYGSGGWGSHGMATEEERRLTMMLFSGIFDALAQRAYDPELFSKALPCLTAIGCALSPDYTLNQHVESLYNQYAAEANDDYIPNPANTQGVRLSEQLSRVCIDFAEHYHDTWAMTKIEMGWTYGHLYDEEVKQHPHLRSFQLLNDREKARYIGPIEESIKAMVSWGWSLDVDSARAISKQQIKRKMSKLSLGDFSPRPVDLRGVTLTRSMLEMAEKVAENSHEAWARKKKMELDAIGGGIHPRMVPFAIQTDSEKKSLREKAQELLRFMQIKGFRIMGTDTSRSKQENSGRRGRETGANGIAATSTEKRFAFSLLEKLLEYVDKAAMNMKNTKPASRYSRRHSFSISTEDVKFFGKVVLPLVEKYFRAHKEYFITNPNLPIGAGTATIKEKEMTASLFSKLALLLRQKINAFGQDVQISVRCLQTLVTAIDAKAIVKSSPEIIRSSILPFLTFAADDLTQTVSNLKIGRFSHLKGTITRGATSLNYVHMVLLPSLTSMFDHLGRHGFGADLLVGEEQLCCYRILNALYCLGTASSTFVPSWEPQRASIMAELDRHRPALGECVASFASTFPVAFLEPQLNKYNKHSVLFGIEEDRIAAHSLEAKEVMDEVALNVPSLEKIVAEVNDLAQSGGKYNEAPHVIEVTLPMLCSYLPFWWSRGPDNVQGKSEGEHETTVTAELMNSVLGNVLKLIMNNIGVEDAPWMNRIATRTQPIIVNATLAMLTEHLLPVAEKLKDDARYMEKMEEEFLAEMRRLRLRADLKEDDEDNTVQERYQILARDMYAFYPLLIKYVDLHRSHWLKNPCPEAERLYLCVAEMFNLWSKSHLFKKEEQNFVFMNEIDNMALIMPSQEKGSVSTADEVSENTKRSKKKLVHKMELNASLNVACLKRLLPIGLNMFGGREQELVQQAKQMLIEHHESGAQLGQKELEQDVEDFLKMTYQSEDKMQHDDSLQWQKALYKKIGSKKGAQQDFQLDYAIERVMAMAKVLYGLHLVEHPLTSMEHQWKKAISAQRKRAVMACFRMAPLYNLPRHRAINLFLKAYRDQWLLREEPGHGQLIEGITVAAATGPETTEEEKQEDGPQPLSQLITAFSRAATTASSELLEKDCLYVSYANIMSQSCHGEDEDDDDEEADGGDEEGDAGLSLQEQEMEKQKLLFEQSRLADRGAAEMVLMYISSSKGGWSGMVISTIELGISILRGGNVAVQKKMYEHLREKKDVGFFTSVAGLMQQCSVLDLDAFERYNKAEGLGMTDGSAQVKNLHDQEDTCKLFRFLQLLCEGHNLEFQNYLRTQAGNTTTVNIIICTVDYLLRLQESIMDFYWHYCGKETIDQAGKESFFRAIKVAAQVFRSITEYIQGPCQGNQLALAHSRLWDAVGGFLYIFAHMQEKLSKDPEQLELLREFMRLQKEMMIMLLSMLEGNVVNGPIGKQMVDTLVESSANFEMILKFFDIFLKMKDIATSEAFMEFDINQDGVISPKEFRRAMEVQKIYSAEEIEYIMMCVDANQDGKVDFNEFTDRFHNPAKDIGFNVAVLLTNLSEHIPNDPRIERFLEKARSVIDYFEQYLGRIEIMGSAGRIERVYFEIKQSHIDQWEKPQIKESKRAFLHNIVNEEGEKGKLECFLNFCEDTIFEESKRAFLHSVVNEEGDKEKLESFTNFCEDTIFEMQHATSISAEEQSLHLASYAKPHSESGGVTDIVKSGYGSVREAIGTVLSCLSPSNIRDKYRLMRSMTYKELAVGFCRLNLHSALTLLTFLFTVLWTFVKFIYVMMRGPESRPVRMRGPEGSLYARQRERRSTIIMAEGGGPPADLIPLAITPMDGANGDARYAPSTPMELYRTDGANGFTPSEGEIVKTTVANGIAGELQAPAVATLTPKTKSALNGTVPSAAPRTPSTPDSQRSAEKPEATEAEAGPSAGLEEEPPMEFKERGMNVGKFFLCLFARNYYNFKLIALAVAFAINFVLLFYKVETYQDELADLKGESDVADAQDDGDDADEEPLEYLQIPDSVIYMRPLIRILAMSHTFMAFGMIIAYYCLKVPLVVFKREKEIARKLEFEGTWVAEQPSDDDIKGHWDKLAISTRSFPDKYWDKFVKKKVRNKYSEQYDYDQISSLLGMDKGDSLTLETKKEPSILPAFLSEIDWQYQIWKWGIIFTDQSFLYITWYFCTSVLGNFNYFFFAAHLLDVAICFKTLGTILQSVTHNGKQLVLTVMLLSIVVYVYTVIAFTFFRKFYIKEEDGEVDYKCHDMFTCYVYHLYVGVRAGGGIGDEINSPDGDPYEVYRILFDITFFFFVIIILLAIIQGLIIDAFGELRDQLEQVKEDLESSCFICGIGKDYFDKIPHGFETHVKNEHNFANYMFFLMHLINKPDTEYTGQESYVWELYQQRCWDFFPVGDCFRKQYEEVLGIAT